MNLFDSVLLPALSIYLTLNAIYRLFNLRSCKLATGKTIGYKQGNGLSSGYQTVVSFETKEQNKGEIEIPFYLSPYPEGYKINIFIKKHGEKYKYYLISHMTIGVGLFCFFIPSFCLLTLDEDLFSIYHAAFISLFVFAFLLVISGLVIDAFMLRRKPQIFLPKATKKISKEEYKRLTEKDILSYDDFINFRHYQLSSPLAYLLVACGIIYACFTIYTNWMNLHYPR